MGQQIRNDTVNSNAMPETKTQEWQYLSAEKSEILEIMSTSDFIIHDITIGLLAGSQLSS